jgi:hypothetical protein
MNRTLARPQQQLMPATSDRKAMEFLRFSRAQLKKKDTGGWTPLFDEAFKGNVNGVFWLLKAARREFGETGVRKYVRTKDDLGIDACGWAMMHQKKQWQVIELLEKYGGRMA